MNCKHCGKEIKPCWLGHISIFCFGWLHLSNYHDCEDGLHKAEPASPAQPEREVCPTCHSGSSIAGPCSSAWHQAKAVAQPCAGGPINPFDMLKLDKIRMRAEEGYDISYNDVLYLIHGISKLLNPSTRPSSPSGQAAATTPECDCGAGPHLKTCNLGLYKGAASPTGGAEPPKCPTCGDEIGEGGATLEEIKNWKRPAAAELLKQSPVKFKHNGFEHAVDRMAQGIIDGHPGSTLTAAYRAVALELHSSISSRQPPAAEPSAWPSDLPANGMGAMNLLTNFWTGDLKGLTKEGARIVDSLVAHVTKGLRDEVDFFQREMDNFRRNRDHRIVQLEGELATAREDLKAKLDRMLLDAKQINSYAKTGKQEALLKVLGHTTGMTIRIERELAALAPAKEPQ